MTTPSIARATASASADLPEQVGPDHHHRPPGQIHRLRHAAFPVTRLFVMSLSYTITLVARRDATTLTDADARAARDMVKGGVPVILSPGEAVDIPSPRPMRACRRWIRCAPSSARARSTSF
jgi:hypothetical protein